MNIIIQCRYQDILCSVLPYTGLWPSSEGACHEPDKKIHILPELYAIIPQGSYLTASGFLLLQY